MRPVLANTDHTTTNTKGTGNWSTIVFGSPWIRASFGCFFIAWHNTCVYFRRVFCDCTAQTEGYLMNIEL